MTIFGNKKEYELVFPKHSPELIKKVIEESNLLIGKKILEGQDFVMPESLGIIFVAKQKTKRVFDYINFCKTGIMKQLNNFKTFGFLYKIMWFKGSGKDKLSHNIYKFRGNRQYVTRPLSQILQSGNDYYKDEEYIKRFYNTTGKKL